MDVLGLEGAAVRGTGQDELLPQPDGEGLASTQEEDPALGGDPLVELGAEAGSEANTGGRRPVNGAALETDEPLDPALEQLFRQANAEAQESLAASEPPDIPIQDLLNELVSLGRCLGIEPPARAQPAKEGDPAEPECSPHSDVARPPLAGPWYTPRGLLSRARLPLSSIRRDALHDLFLRARLPLPGSRRHALHGLLLTLTLVMAIASVLIGADRMVNSGQNQSPKPPAVATAPSGVAVRQVQPDQSAPDATPAPTTTRQPAYFMYTVQRGDTLTAIAAAFGLSLDHIIWANPETIDDPDLLLTGDRLLIPSVTGMIYYVKPGDVLSAIGRLLPAREPDTSGLAPERPQPPP
jgi:LysM repeat protein